MERDAIYAVRSSLHPALLVRLSIDIRMRMEFFKKFPLKETKFVLYTQYIGQIPHEFTDKKLITYYRYHVSKFRLRIAQIP